MKTLLTLISFVFIFGITQAQIFHEDFENPDSVVSSGSIGFAQCTRIAAGGNACDSSSYGINDTTYLSTISFSTVGNSNVILTFDQICKIEFFDRGIVQVSNDGGLTWTTLTGAQYLGYSNFAFQGNKFTEAAYPTWYPGDTTLTPQNTWWNKEIFDISAIAANSPNVIIRFEMRDFNNNGMNGRIGWYIDNLQVNGNFFNVYNYQVAYNYLPCFNIPQLCVFSVSIAQSGYSYNDSVLVSIDFGDGTDTSFYAHPDTLSYYNIIHVQHYYLPNASYPFAQSISDLSGNTFNYTDTVKLNTGTCGNLTGKVYNDNNSNCVYDAGDAPLPNSALTLKSSTGIFIASAFADINGDYLISVNSAQPLPYSLSLTLPQTLSTIICPASNPVAINTVPSNNDFAIACVPGFDADVYGSFTGMRLLLPVTIYADACNYYCQIDSGYLKVVLDNKLNFVSASPPGYFLSGDTVTWSNVLFNNISNSHAINTVKKPLVAVGDSICITYIAETLPGDLDPVNNTMTVCQVVTNSLDPNFKEVNPPSTIDTNATLDYTIHFQNTGNDTAYQVIITDTLDANLDVSALRINGGSHNFSTNVYPNNLLVFTFNNIMLPDSGANQLASNGFVSYSIKLKSGTPVGTHVYNSSMIFFDSNQPVKTNTTDNLIVIPNGVNSVDASDEVLVYPNPATNSVTIKLNNEHLTTNRIQLFNMLGENVYLKNNGIDNETVIQLGRLPKGVYTLVVESKNNIITKKILKL